jgi:hypothetical protein
MRSSGAARDEARGVAILKLFARRFKRTSELRSRSLRIPHLLKTTLQPKRSTGNRHQLK